MNDGFSRGARPFLAKTIKNVLERDDRIIVRLARWKSGRDSIKVYLRTHNPKTGESSKVIMAEIYFSDKDKLIVYGAARDWPEDVPREEDNHPGARRQGFAVHAKFDLEDIDLMGVLEELRLLMTGDILGRENV